MKIVIVGGGITGLSAAWYAHKTNPKAKITLLEKTDRLGGWIRTSQEGGFLFEKGPRTFMMGRSPHLLQLIHELGLEILFAPPQKRYLYHEGRLRSFGSFLPGLIPYLIREPFVPASKTQDESIYDFAARRFSPKIAETLFDPMTLGIYGGDIRKLSIRRCFPALYNWERENGSVLRGLFSAPKKKKGLFTLKGGMQTLIEALKRQIPMEVIFNCTAESIKENIKDADKVIDARPPALPARSLWVVNLVFEGDVLKKKGFGYLVPTKEKQSLLGVVFDSSIFPDQNTQGEARLTAMIRSEEQEPLQSALQAMQVHLGISKPPLFSSIFFAKNAIPQFEVGCTYRHGISVDACVLRGKEAGLSVLSN